MRLAVCDDRRVAGAGASAPLPMRSRRGGAEDVVSNKFTYRKQKRWDNLVAQQDARDVEIPEALAQAWLAFKRAGGPDAPGWTAAKKALVAAIYDAVQADVKLPAGLRALSFRANSARLEAWRLTEALLEYAAVLSETPTVQRMVGGVVPEKRGE